MTLEIPTDWGVLTDDGEPDAAGDAQLASQAREAEKALLAAGQDERAARSVMMRFFQGWEQLCDLNPSASDTDVREVVREVFEKLLGESPFQGRGARWWAEAGAGLLDREIPPLTARLPKIASAAGVDANEVAAFFARLSEQARAALLGDQPAQLPGLAVLERRSRFVRARHWPSSEEVEPEDPPLRPVDPRMTALLEDVRANGPLHVPALGVVWEQVFPAYEGRNPRTGEAIPVPEKRIFRLLLDESFAVSPEAEID